jgi:hypothetical protein
MNAELAALRDECVMVAGIVCQIDAGEAHEPFLAQALGRLHVRIGNVHRLVAHLAGRASEFDAAAPRAALLAALLEEQASSRKGKKGAPGGDRLHLLALAKRCREQVNTAQLSALQLVDALSAGKGQRDVALVPLAQKPITETVARELRPAKRAPTVLTGEAAKLRTGAREMLRVLAEFAPITLTRHQTVFAAGTSPKSSTVSTYWGELKQLGLIEERGRGEWTVTPAGAAAGGPPRRQLGTVEGRAEVFRLQLRDGASRMLDAMLMALPSAGLTREELATRAGVSFTSSTLSTYLGELSSNRLVLAERGRPLRVHPWLLTGRTSHV